MLNTRENKLLESELKLAEYKLKFIKTVLNVIYLNGKLKLQTMITLDIILQDEQKAGEISAFLIKHKYALQTHIDTNTILTANGQKKTIRLFFITKALLYDLIEQEVKSKFFTDDMIIYATPVSHMNEEFGKLLRNNLKAA